MPCKVAPTTDAHDRFVCLEGPENHSKVKALLNWVIEEVKILLLYAHSREFVAAADLTK
jgi:hypothetical protein